MSLGDAGNAQRGARNESGAPFFLFLFFCCCVNWISALPVPPWQASDWINGVESTAAWQEDRLLAQLGSWTGAPGLQGALGGPPTP